MANFYLSHWNAAEKVYVPEGICRKLKPYHVSIVRSIHRVWEKKFSGAVLNYDEGIDVQLAFQALWQALINANKITLSFLIIVSDKNIVPWHFYLSKLGEVVVLNNQNIEAVSTNKTFSIVLVPQSNIKLLRACEENDYSFIVVENFENVATTRLFKRLSGRFNIALTSRNFMVNRDYKILWHILNWTNPGKFGKLGEFSEFDRDHLENLRNPYDDVWYTYNCNIGEYDLVKTEDEKEEFEKLLNEWVAKHDFLNINASIKSPRKRRSNPTKGPKTKRSKKKNFNKEYHEQSTQLASNPREQNEVKGNVKQDDEKRKKLRDISDLSYSHLINSYEAPITTRKDVEMKPFFNPTSVKRKPFDFKVGRQNNTATNETSKQSNDKVASNRLTKDHVFPSLEDILKFKKKNLDVSRPSTQSTTNNIRLDRKDNSNKKEVTDSDLPDLGGISLEEIFKCKRKLHDNPQALKKLHTDNSTSSTQTMNNNSKSFTPVTFHVVNGSYPSKKKENSACNRNRVKAFDSRYKIIYKNDKQVINTSTKETQTCNDLLLIPTSVNESQKKDIAVDTAEMGVISSKELDEADHRGDRNNKYNLEDTKSIKKSKDEEEMVSKSKHILNGNNVKENEDSSTSIRGSPLQNLTNMDTDDLVKDEDGGILLSIIEGKFMSQSNLNINESVKQKSNKSDDINCNRTSPNFGRCNTQMLLESLFGDSEGTENNLDDNEDAIFSSLNRPIGDPRLNSSLRVKTIDQINKETSSQPSQNICDSMKILFGSDEDVCSDLISNSNKLAVPKHDRHHLLSSLFG